MKGQTLKVELPFNIKRDMHLEAEAYEAQRNGSKPIENFFKGED